MHPIEIINAMNDMAVDAAKTGTEISLSYNGYVDALEKELRPIMYDIERGDIKDLKHSIDWLVSCEKMANTEHEAAMWRGFKTHAISVRNARKKLA